MYHCGSRPLPKKQGLRRMPQTSFGTEAIESSTATSDEQPYLSRHAKGASMGWSSIPLKDT
jgi:hypothetical protein